MTEPGMIDSQDLDLRHVPPEDAPVAAVIRFAHTIDGYLVAGSFEDAARIARNPDPRSLDDQRIALFFHIRSLRHTGEEESPEDLRFFRDKLRRIRELLTVVLAVLCLGLGTVPAAMSAEEAAGQAGGEQAHLSVELPPELARVLRDYEAAWAAGDAAGLAALFTEDGFVLSSGRPPVRGREAIEERYAGSGGPLALRALAYGTEGGLGYVIGAFAREAGDPDLGKFTLVVRQGDDGRWLIVSDMDNGNHRRPAP